LYELLTLHPPFAADSRDRLLGMVIQKEPAPPHRLNHKVPRDLETICLKCLEKDPDRRYATAGELAADLRRFVERQPIQARRPGPLKRLRKRVARNPALSALAAAVVVAVAVAAVLGVRSYRAEQDRIADERRREIERTEERKNAAIERGMVAAFAADFVAADAALAEAESLGAGSEDTDVLRGVIETYRGNHDLAVECLERAVTARPDSIRNRALLCNSRGDDRAVYVARDSLAKLDGVPVVSPDDKLFKGFMMSYLRPADGLAMMEEGMRERPSTLGRVLLADTRRWLAYNTADLSHALAGCQDTEVLKSVFPNSTRIACMSVSAKLTAATAYDVSGDKQNARRMTQVAREEADGLRNDTLETIAAKWHALLYAEGLNPRTEWIPAVAEPSIRANDVLTFSFALSDRMFGHPQEARRRIDTPNRGTFASCALAILALDRPDGLSEARRIWREFSLKQRDPAPAMVGSAFAILLGDRDEIVDVAKQIRAEDQPVYGMTRRDRELIRAYMLGEISDADFVKEKTESRVWQSWRHFLVGLRRLRNGDRAQAREAFQAAYEFKTFTYLHWDFALLFVVLIDREPAWPRALPQKK
jgi:hypothetical protein